MIAKRGWVLFCLVLMVLFSFTGLNAQEFGGGSLFDYDFSGSRSLQPENPPTISEENLPDPEPSETPENQEPTSAPVFPMEKRFLKKSVEIPPPPPRRTVEAGDIRDPFFLIRGYREDAKDALEPGVTIDGIRFNSYADSEESELKFYQDSNFSLEDVFGKIRVDNRDEGCQFCHHGIEEISSSHKLECTDCHGGNSGTRNRSRAHKSMASNPSSPEHAARYCGKCHADQVAWMERSLMATAKGIIDQTHRAWGHPSGNKTTAKETQQSAKKTDKPDDSTKSSKNSEQKVSSEATPVPSGLVKNHAQDFLDKKCLRCHLGSEAPRRTGDYRSTGCAACHMVYTNDGSTLTRDRAVQRSIKGGEEVRTRFLRKEAENAIEKKRAYPVVHQLTVAVPSVQCEHCHQNNGVGNEYEGLFATPARPKDSQKLTGQDDPVLHGRQYEFLVPDIHRERGMHCIDCHSANEMKSPPEKSETLHDTVTIRCEDCHGTHEKGPTGRKLAQSNTGDNRLVKLARLNPNLNRKLRGKETILITEAGHPMPHIFIRKNKWELVSKVTGKRHTIPLLKDMDTRPVAHRVGQHLQKVECHACHARWSASEWGLHTIKENQFNITQWENWSFPDPVLNHLKLSNNLNRETDTSQSLLWPTVKGNRESLTGEWSPGLWINLLARSDWSTMILGKNKRGKVTILKPRHQYFVTNPASDESTTPSQASVPAHTSDKPALVLTPHAPHTIRPTARTCEACHENQEAVGLGADYLQNVDKGKGFFEKWKEDGTLPDDFQLSQSIAEDGTALQTVLPKPARALNLKEAQRLLKPSKKYEVSRYLDLKEKNLDVLLNRKSFPYDRLHELKKRKYGEPSRQEDLYYNKETGQFETSLPLDSASQDTRESNEFSFD
ncbi:MAG: hypothetical protein G3M70_02335 [Candidatus Nitronauta litoralis]|uniref:Uncharacterized protein n=1 Tax=Candidatus Nitronauta litoralis TaxID=2705533 RepID=A0A7T0BUN9_9BACT|nr:MAG: hypothetical protein G3M70_02335 [Candidatus Nitronauta litoralis]